MEIHKLYLVKIKGMQGVHTAQYDYINLRWWINGFNGKWEVDEYWQFPEAGTGQKGAPEKETD